MNTDKVLEMAREADTHDDLMLSERDFLSNEREYFERFAALLQREMEAENAELLKDAERYRWLRQMDRCEPWSDLLMSPILRTEDIDEAIDRARSANE